MGLNNRFAPVAIGALLLAAAVLQSPARADEITDRAQRLIAERNAQEAYRLLDPLEQQRAGNVEFDYLLGMAALDAGHVERAVFALERVLALQPGHAQARAEIARAYFMLGEKENARRELQSVRVGNPPEAVRQTIDRYLSVLGAEPARLSGFIEAGFGRDTNVNSATGSSQIAVPALGGAVATLDASGVKKSDNFSTAGGALNYTLPVSSRWALVTGVAASGKFNSRYHDFSNASIEGNLGMRWTPGREAVSLGYQAQEFRVGGNAFRSVSGIVGQWQHQYGARTQASLFAQSMDLKYANQPLRDARRTTFGLAFGHGWDARAEPLVFGSLYRATEKEKAPYMPQLGHQANGLRLGVQALPAAKAVFFVIVSQEQRNYSGEDPFFLVIRQDRQRDLRLGINIELTRNWMLTPQIVSTDNRSNITLHTYKQTMASIAVRRTF